MLGGEKVARQKNKLRTSPRARRTPAPAAPAEASAKAGGEKKARPPKAAGEKGGKPAAEGAPAAGAAPAGAPGAAPAGEQKPVEMVHGVAKQPTAEDLLKEELGTVKVRKAKGSKNVTSGYANVLASFNNTSVSITDQKGAVIAWSSAGKCN